MVYISYLDNFDMKRIQYTLLILMIAAVSYGQISYNKTKLPPVPLSKKVTLLDESETYQAQFEFHAAPRPGNTNLADIKEEVSRLYPKKPHKSVDKRNDVGTPDILNGFAGNAASGIPLDNHLSVSNDGQVFSAINSNVTIYDAQGTKTGKLNFNDISEEVVLPGNKFDPRTFYDPVNDRFVLLFLHASSSSASQIVFGFSETSHADSLWNFYALSGNPFDNGTWSDYPMISHTETEMFLTINLLRDGESWQEGFEETLIYQINKLDGYAGEELNVTMYDNVELDGLQIRNTYPVKYADEIKGDNIYFLSNRNFSIENDTIFFMQITGTQDDPNTTLEVQVLNADVPYGVPPSASQTTNAVLETNDARILDGFYLDDRIQFVSNTVNHESGLPNIYHGIITNINSEPVLRANILDNDNMEYGYPGISWAGYDRSENAAIISALHTSTDSFPGMSALFVDNDFNYSPWVITKAGLDIMKIQNGNVHRWGDYSGSQRMFNTPGNVWVSGAYAIETKKNKTWIVELGRPIESNTIDRPVSMSNAMVYPNPILNRAEYVIDIKEKKRMTISLYDQSGKLVKLFMDDLPKKVGQLKFSFNMDALKPGVYFLSAVMEGNEILTEKIVKQ